MTHATTVSPFPLPGLIAVIDPTGTHDLRVISLPERCPAMGMKESRAHELAMDAGAIRKLVIRLATTARDAQIDDEEWEVLRRLSDHEDGLTEKAEDELLAVGLFRRGRHSDHVQRLARQVLPEPDSAA